MRFTETFSTESVNFLNLTLQGNKLTAGVDTLLYRKPNSGNTLLNAASCHLRNTIHSISTGEYSRTKQACSSAIVLKAKLEDINKRLRQRGYDNRCLRPPRLKSGLGTHFCFRPETKTKLGIFIPRIAILS